MAPQFEYSQSTHAEDVQQFGDLLSQCFIAVPGFEEDFINRVGVQNIRLIRDSQQIAAGLELIPMGQWWGGECIPMVGIAGVGVAPEYRGTGVALNLIQNAVKELYSTGVPISVLYPAVQRLYRKAGYEQAGSTCIWEVSTENIQLTEQPLSVKPVVSISYEVFEDLYQQQAKLNNGYLNRNPAIWKQEVLFTREQEKLYAYWIGSIEQPQGYIIFSQHRENDGTVLRVRDWAVLTTAAAKTFWSFLANHRSTIGKVQWIGSAIDLLSLLLPEQVVKQKHIKRWQLRVINVVKALEMRGYPSGIQTELHLLVQQDNLVPENNGKFILSVADERAQVTRGGKGELKVDIDGLAPLYTGLFTPKQLQLAGKLDATEASLSVAAQLFAGASPWMADFF